MLRVGLRDVAAATSRGGKDSLKEGVAKTSTRFCAGSYTLNR
jgi:hypothetical protein